MKKDDELTDEQIHEINQEVKEGHQWLEKQDNQQASPSRGDEYLQEMGQVQKRSDRYVGNGTQTQNEFKLDIGLSQGLKNRIQDIDFRGGAVCLIVGKKREPLNNATHWVAVKSGEWPLPKIAEDTIDGIWIDKKAGRFAFVLSMEFIKEFRTMTSKGNQKLFLNVRFGVKATAGKIWIQPA